MDGRARAAGAVGIDSAGDIVAYGTNSSAQMQEYLLTPAEVPAPEPGTLAIWGLIASCGMGKLVADRTHRPRV